MNQAIKFILRIFLLAAFLGAIAFLCSCSAQDRLNRIVRHHPELVKSDTVFQTRTITLPGYTVAASGSVNPDYSGLYSIIDSLRRSGSISGQVADNTVREIRTYVTTRSVLRDTIRRDIPGGGWVKVFQSGNEISALIHAPAQSTIVPTQTVVNKTETHNHYPWQMFAGGTLFGILLIAGIGGALIYNIRKTS